ncbi:MAG: NAD(P)-dependent oxidoreductase [Candidatus Omnitrophica bacterium]|nr:NAD(P)-dependent oxidoreductase [Candidatus Omnitrophota bacterium]
MAKPDAKILKVGITGAGGNVGTTLRKGLGGTYELTVFDMKEIDHPEGKFIKVDFADSKQVGGVFNGLDALIHLAGDPRPNAPRTLTMRNNFLAASFAFEEARKAGVRKIVYASSNFYHEGAIGEILQGTQKHLITLDMPPTPLSLYGESKVFGEMAGRHLAYHGIQFVALRIGWTVPQDDPSIYGGSYMRAVFCSKRDLVQAFTRALEIETDFMAAFTVSNNTNAVFDLTETRKKLGFDPQDNAEDYF